MIAGASALVLTSYLVRCKPGEPMPDATMKAIEYAKKHDVPVVLTLGTKYVIADNPAWWQEFLQEHVSILAMNEEEGEALTGFCRSAVSGEKALDWVDLVLCTAGPAGLYMAGFTEEEAKRKTQHPLLPGRSRSLTSLNSAARCVTRTALIRCVSIPTSLPYGRP